MTVLVHMSAWIQLRSNFRMKTSPSEYAQCTGRNGCRWLGMLAAVFLAGCSAQEPETQGTEPRVRLITTDQYVNSMRYVFGAGIELRVEFPPFERTEGLLGNSSAFAGISSSQLEQFQSAAASVARQVVDPSNREFLIPCKPAVERAADTACATEFLSSTGRLLYRRPLTGAELEQFVDNAASGADTLNDFYAGLELALEAMLLSPDVLYIVDRVEPDPDNDGHWRLDAYSLAARLSYFLWNASPDAELLDAAASGDLQTKPGRVHAVDRMLASPRLADGVRAFFDDMYRFSDIKTISKDPAIYPQFQSATAAAAREQTLRTVIDHLITKKKSYLDLYTTRSTFMSPDLATVYETSPPSGWVPYMVPSESQRIGLLGQVSFLALHAHPGRSSATLRGTALRETLLCQEVPPPPPNVDFSVLNNPDSNYPTQRDRVRAHLENPSCAGCHLIIDPIGLGLENFDGEGRYRLRENGALIDASGDLDGVQFEDAAGLAHALKDNWALPKCLVQRMYYYSVGGPTVASYERLAFLNYMNQRFAADEYRLLDLLRTIVLSNAFTRITVPAQAESVGHETNSDIRQNWIRPDVALEESGGAMGDNREPRRGEIA